MRYVLLLALLPLGCSVADLLEGKSCNNGADCGGGQTCVRTLTQENENDLGTCSSTGECVFGEQEGCACDGACTGFACVEHLSETEPSGAALRFCCDSDCGDGKEVVVGSVNSNQGFNARCMCCDVCDGSMGMVRDPDAAEDNDCACMAE